MIIRLLIIVLLAAGIFGGAYYALHRLYLEPEQRLMADKKLPPPTPPPDPSFEEFARCEELRRTSTLVEARAIFERFLKEFPESKKKNAALDALGEINSTEFFAIQPTEENTYIVRSGDSINRVAGHTKLPVEFIVYFNKLHREMLQPGQQLLAPACSFRVVLQQKSRRVALYNGDKFFRQYPATTWPGEHRRPVIFLAKQSGKVVDKIARNNKSVVKPTDIAYYDAMHILATSIPGHALYSASPAPSAQGFSPNGGGIGLDPAHMSEIAILLPRGTPVTLE